MAFFDRQEETLDAEAVRTLQRVKLGGLLSVVRSSNDFYRERLADVRFNAGSDDMSVLPLLSRTEIEADQQGHPPYGTIHTFPIEKYNRFHQTSGTGGQPLRCLDTPRSWAWWKRCWSIVFKAGGLRDDDRLMFPFSFGPFVGFWSAFEAAADLGNLCLPAGGMTSAARLRYMLDNGVTVVCCTPTYAMHLAETAHEEGIDLAGSTVRMLIVAGEPGGNVAAVKSRIESAWGARVIDHVGMTEMGAWGFECAENPGGIHVIETEFIAEIIDPDSHQPLPDGQSGELVLTNLGRTGLPMIRYRTGDSAALTRGLCACGRWFARIEGGIAGRIDDMFLIRGNNVFPSAIEGILREFDEVAEFRLTVEDRDAMDELRIEIEPYADRTPEGLADRIARAVRDRLNFRPIVESVPSGTLPRFDLKAQRVRRGGSPS